MKKGILLSLALSLNLLANETITIGATPVPHAEILEFIKPDLAKKGYDLQIKEFNDYIIPNTAVDEGELDANFYQHEPYLIEFNKNNSTNLVKVASVHLEPMGVYSKKIKNISDLKEGDTIAVPNDPTNEDRALVILEKAGLIKLGEGTLRTPLDIVENKKNLKFVELEAPQLPKTLDDTTLAVINANFAINSGLNPTKDALLLEDKGSKYANLLVVKKGNENSEKIKALSKELNSEKLKNFINDKYKGEIIPAF